LDLVVRRGAGRVDEKAIGQGAFQGACAELSEAEERESAQKHDGETWERRPGLCGHPEMKNGPDAAFVSLPSLTARPCSARFGGIAEVPSSVNRWARRQRDGRGSEISRAPEIGSVWSSDPTTPSNFAEQGLRVGAVLRRSVRDVDHETDPRIWLGTQSKQAVPRYPWKAIRSFDAGLSVRETVWCVLSARRRPFARFATFGEWGGRGRNATGARWVQALRGCSAPRLQASWAQPQERMCLVVLTVERRLKASDGRA
jgi:hypothetical protein